MTHLNLAIEHWPLHSPFTIARGTKTAADVIVATLTDQQGLIGRGEAVPYGHYGESTDPVYAQIMAVRDQIERPMTPQELHQRNTLPPGAGRAAVDAALWDLHARQTNLPVWRHTRQQPPHTYPTAYTLSLGSPAQMATVAERVSTYPLLKLKLGGDNDIACVTAVRNAAPDCRLIVDVNEGWSLEQLNDYAPRMADLGVELLEQPLPPAQDTALDGYCGAVPLCADESFHHSDDFATLSAAYGYINIKMEKTGGLTEALRCAEQAESMGLKLMVGCMVATSLAMAPAFLLAGRAEYIDLDGPLLLRNDRPEGFVYHHGYMSWPPHSPKHTPLWGYASD